MDWNWFFSALSQSTAAIVGIFGAFIITKILSNQTIYVAKLEKSKELLSTSKRLVEDAGFLAFSWYIKQTSEEEYEKLDEILDNDGNSLSAEEYYGQLDFSIYTPRENVINIIQIKINRCGEGHKEDSSSVSLTNYSGQIMLPPNHKFIDVGLPVQIEKEREAIDLVLRNIRSHIRTTKDFLETVSSNPESSPQITYTLLLISLLFFVGVIYPLSFLPMPSDGTVTIDLNAVIPTLLSFKGGLLIIISLIFSSVLIMFLMINHRMKYNSKEISRLEQYTKLPMYSKYFGFMESNIINNQGKVKKKAPLTTVQK